MEIYDIQASEKILARHDQMVKETISLHAMIGMGNTVVMERYNKNCMILEEEKDRVEFVRGLLARHRM